VKVKVQGQSRRTEYPAPVIAQSCFKIILFYRPSNLAIRHQK